IRCAGGRQGLQDGLGPSHGSTRRPLPGSRLAPSSEPLCSCWSPSSPLYLRWVVDFYIVSECSMGGFPLLSYFRLVIGIEQGWEIARRPKCCARSASWASNVVAGAGFETATFGL